MSDNKKIQFPKVVYRREDLTRAIEDYQTICHIQMEEDDRNYICSFSNSKVDLQLTILEFSNYLVELRNSRS